jgi:ribosomal protein S18 acetylase RimI-like enzyme
VITVLKLTNPASSWMPSLAELYQAYTAVATTDYGLHTKPVGFDMLLQRLQEGVLEGYLIQDTAENRPLGFFLFCHEALQPVIEVQLLYLVEDVSLKATMDALMRTFLTDIKRLAGWNTVSYAMLGKQERAIRVMPWYGFKPTGQAVLTFALLDVISIEILKKQTFQALPINIQLVPGRELSSELLDSAAQCIYACFSNASDALWDPRFRTVEGSKEALALITSGAIGTHLLDFTTLAVQNNQVVGFCFVVADDLPLDLPADHHYKAHIPLIGVHPAVRKQGLGNHLLNQSLRGCLEAVLSAKLDVESISATVDTDNWKAIKLYRRFAFQETNSYPHLSLSREALERLALKPWNGSRY